MELQDALSRIAEIQLQMKRASTFRGYRSTTTAFSAVVALVAAAAQSVFVPTPRHAIDAYLLVWFVTAALCICVVGIEIAIRYRRTESNLQRELTIRAVEQFVPYLAVGGLLTLAMGQSDIHSLWLAPPLWIILFGLGVFASRRLLPPAVKYVGGFYLLCGLLEIAMGPGIAFSPLEMAIPFGIGQPMAAFILYWNLERTHAPE